MSTSSGSTSEKERGSTKKKKKQPKDKRSDVVNNEALSPVLEGDDQDLYDSEGNLKEQKEGGDEDYEQEGQQLIFQALKRMELSITKNIQDLGARVTSLEARRNLNKESPFETPTKKKKKSKRSTNLVESVAYSTVKRDWKDMAILAQGEGQSGHGDGGDDSSSSSDSSTLSSSSNDDETKQDSYSADESDSSLSAESGDKSKKKEKVKKKKKKKKRKDSEKETGTHLGYLFKSIGESEKKAAATVVNVTRTEKECNVRITNFSLGHVCKAMKTIMEFQEREQTLVNMAKVLSRACKQHLKIMYNIQSTDLHSMGMSRLFGIIAQETKVYSKVDFYNQLKEALGDVQLMDWAKVNSRNHEDYYFQQLKLADEFMMLFRIMLQENKAHCPKINDKENGLIRLFKSYHSSKYWQHLWTNMKQDYKTMQQFMDEYCDSAMQHYQLSVAVKAIPYLDSSKSSDKEKQYYDRKREIGKSFNSSSYSKAYDKPKHNSFHNINTEFSGSDSEGSTCWRNANPVVKKEDTELADEQAVSNSEDSLSEASNEREEFNDEDEGMLDRTLAAFNNHKEVKADKKDYPCLRKIMSGKCEQADCPYGHRRDVLLKGAQDMKSKLSAFITSQGEPNKESTGPPYKVLQREKYSKN